MNIEKLKFKIAAGESIELPDYGQIEVVSYLSADQMNRYHFSVSKDSNSAFFELIETLLSDSEVVKSLSISDLDVLAEYYTEKLKVKEVYQTQYAKGTPVYEAFYHAYQQSSVYRSLEKFLHSFTITGNAFRAMQKAMVPDLWALKSIQSVIESQRRIIEPIQSHLMFDSSFAKLATASLPNLLSNYDIALHQKLFAENLNFFKKYDYSQFIIPEAIRGTLDSFRGLTEHIQAISSTYTLLSDEAIQALETQRKLPEEWFLKINDYISASSQIIADTNAFFREEGSLRANLTVQGVEEDIFIDDYENTKSSTHDSASGLLLTQNELIEQIEEIIDETIEQRLSRYNALLDRMNFLADTPNFLTVLQDFALSISRTHWDVFWERRGKKFRAAPEFIAQTNLSLFLEGRFFGVAFAGREIASGDGYIDILVNFLGINYIVELKVIGLTKSIGWAESGLHQLDKYMQNFNVKESYLLVFDGRKTEKGRNLKEHYDLPNGRVNVIRVRIYFPEAS